MDSASTAPRRSLFRRLVVASALTVGLTTLGAVTWAVVAPDRSGIPAIAAIGLPYALLVALGMVLVAVLAPRRSAVLLLAGALVIALLVTPRVSGFLSRSRATPPAHQGSVAVVTYNTFVFDREPPDRLIASLTELVPAIIGLQEVTPARGAALATDAALARRYPFREIRAEADGSSLALLSSWPIETYPEIEGLSLIDATVDVDGRPLAVLVVHAPLPLSLSANPFAPERRDTMLDAFRDVALGHIEDGLPVLMMGDLNTTDREVAFGSLATGFQDVHATVGDGLGHSWRLRYRGLMTPPLLRIDHMLVSPDLVPLESRLDCDASASDHCLSWGRLGWAVP
jgi:endonuclease/exonuclease/phosphatase (EEP) superfamily protein YafD